MKISSIYPGVWVMVWIKSGLNKENITLCQTPPPPPQKKQIESVYSLNTLENV